MPDTAAHEEELDEDDSEGDKTGKDGAVMWGGIPWLLWNLARYTVGLGRMIIRNAVVLPDPASNVDERELNEQPQGDDPD